MISTRSDARGATRARDRCERSLDQRRARRWRRPPPRLGLELVDLNPFEQHRQLVDVDRNARYALGDAGRERERPALEALVHDREPAARPQDQLDLVPATIEEHEHVAAERVVAERVADLIGEPLERLPQIRRLGGEVHPHRARQEDHDADLASSHASAAIHAGDTPSISITIPWGSRITAAGAAMGAAPPPPRGGPRGAPHPRGGGGGTPRPSPGPGGPRLPPPQRGPWGARAP